MKEKSKYLSPSEIIYNNPFLSELWTAADIGYLLKLKLVKGRKLIRSSIILESDVLRVYEFYKNCQ
ncbi:MAG: hypothetical protein JXR68_12150 [Bacteroidales bacterium]|nr:hypothetical protein [Bacteroidales bacterium]